MLTKDKEVPESLKQSAEKFKDIIKNAPLAIYEIDFDGSKIRTVNSAVSQWLGYSEKEILAMNPLNLLGEESKKKFQELVKEALTGDKTLFSAEFEVRAKNGKSVWGLFHAKINFKNGKPDTVLVFAQDITERKKAEQELWKAKNDWERTFDAVPDLITILDTKHRIVRANRAMAERLEITPQQAEGLTCYEAVHDATLPPEFCPHAKTLLDGKEHLAEVCEPRLGGDFMVSTTPLKDEKGRLIGSVHVARDITERKKAEEALIDSQTSLQNILNGVDDGIALVGIDGRVIDCNKASEKLLGLTREEFIGTNVYDIVVPEDREQALNGASKVLETGRIVNHVRVLRKNNSAFDAEISVTVVYDKNGKPVSFVGVTRDITERKKADAAIRQSERKLQNIINAMDDGIVLLGMDAKVIDCNQATLNQLKMKREEVIGKVIMDFMFSKNKEDFIKETQDALRKTGKATVETQLQRKNDSPLSVEVSLSRFYDENHNPIGLLGAARDITERKKAEEELRKNRAELQTILDSSQGWIFYEDCENRFVRVNKSFAGVMGLPREQLEGHSIFEFYPKEQAENFWRDGKQVIASGKPKIGIIEPMQSKKGLYWVQTDKVPYYDTEGNIIGVIGFSVDITEQKEMQAKLQEYTNNLENLVEERTKQLQDKERLAAIGQTAGMVGHDIRNPLQAIISELYIARGAMAQAPESKEKQEALESVSFVEEQVNYINKIVSDLQDYARPLNPEYQIVNLPDLIVSVFDATVLPDKIKLKVDVKGTLKLKTDPTFIRRAITNLVNNAIQAMPDGGELGLEARQEEECVVISVSDTGQGIPENVKANLFKPLTTTKAKGQGLGLAVVKRLTEALSGTVSFESQEGKGTTFIIRLLTQSTKR